MFPPSAGHDRRVTEDWRTMLEAFPVETRVKAVLVYELASDRAAGQPLEVASATLRAAAEAEGLDPDQPWIEAAAARISAGDAAP